MKILLTRYDCLGDVLVGTCVLPGLREKYPGAEIWWRCHARSHPMLEGNPLIDKIVAFDPSDMDLRIELNHEARWNGKGPTVETMAEIYCDQAGVPLHRPQLHLTAEERAWADPYAGRIAVCNTAGWQSRTYKHMAAVLNRLKAEGLPMVQVDHASSTFGIPQPQSSIRQAAAIMERCTMYFGIDTVFMHMAVAFERPMVLVMGPTGCENQYVPGAVILRPKPFTSVFEGAYTSGIDYPAELVYQAVVARYEEVAAR